MNVRFYLSYDIKNTVKSHFWRRKCYNVVNIITFSTPEMRFHSILNVI